MYLTGRFTKYVGNIPFFCMSFYYHVALLVMTINLEYKLTEILTTD